MAFWIWPFGVTCALFLQSSTLQAVLQLLAVQSEYANLTAPHDPDPPSRLKDPQQPHSPSVSPPLTQIPLKTPVEYKALGHTDVVSSEAIAQKESPVKSIGSSTSEKLSEVPLLTERISERQKPVFEKIICPVIDIPPSLELITVKLPINPATSPAQLTPAVANITSTDPLMSSCPSPTGSVLGHDNSFPEITHSLAEETSLPEPQLAVSTGSPCVKTIHCLFYIYIHTQLNIIFNPPHGVLHAPSTLPRALAYSNSQCFSRWLFNN